MDERLGEAAYDGQLSTGIAGLDNILCGGLDPDCMYLSRISRRRSSHIRSCGALESEYCGRANASARFHRSPSPSIAITFSDEAANKKPRPEG
jgi:hypothetical protein